MTLLWPIGVLRPKESTRPHLGPRSMAGAAALSGAAQVTASDAGRWFYSLRGFPVVTRAKLLCWEAIEAYLDGALNEIDVPLHDHEIQYSPIATDLDWQTLLTAVPHSDDAFFSDGSGYAIGELTDIVASAAAALRATSMTVTVTYGPELHPGQIFELTHATRGPRWYKVRTYDSATGALTFRPPLREAVASGERLKFTNPKCRMRLTSDDAMMLSQDTALHAFPDVSFVEAL